MHAYTHTHTHTHLVFRERMYEADAALGHGIILVPEGPQDPGHVTQGGHLVSQLRLSAEETHGRRSDHLQGLPLQDIHTGVSAV